MGAWLTHAHAVPGFLAIHSTNEGVLQSNSSVLNADERRPATAETRNRTPAFQVPRRRLYRKAIASPRVLNKVCRC